MVSGMTDNMTAADIRAIRRALSLSTTALAELVGVSRRTVEDWEQGRFRPSGPARILLSKLMEDHHAEVQQMAKGTD